MTIGAYNTEKGAEGRAALEGGRGGGRWMYNWIINDSEIKNFRLLVGETTPTRECQIPNIKFDEKSQNFTQPLVQQIKHGLVQESRIIPLAI